MDVMQAIRTRRSIGKVKPDLPPRASIEAMLEAATQAPNHYKVEPWRFIVMTGHGRDRLGDLMADIERERHPDADSEAARAAIEGARRKAYRAPVVIAVIVDAPRLPQVVPVENIEAVATAVQNMLLTAHALGLGAMWRTGDAAYDPRARAVFGLDADDFLAGFLYVGYPDVDPGPRRRAPFSDKTTWWGDAEGEYSF